MKQESIDQCTIGIPGRRVDDHATGFIYDDDMGILVNNIKGDILWLCFQFFLDDELYGYGITRIQAVIRFDLPAIDSPVTVFNELAGKAAGKREFFRQIGIKPLTRISSRCFQQPCFHEYLRQSE